MVLARGKLQAQNCKSQDSYRSEHFAADAKKQLGSNNQLHRAALQHQLCRTLSRHTLHCVFGISQPGAIELVGGCKDVSTTLHIWYITSHTKTVECAHVTRVNKNAYRGRYMQQSGARDNLLHTFYSVAKHTELQPTQMKRLQSPACQQAATTDPSRILYQHTHPHEHHPVTNHETTVLSDPRVCDWVRVVDQCPKAAPLTVCCLMRQ